jgi:N-acetyltransferase
VTELVDSSVVLRPPEEDEWSHHLAYLNDQATMEHLWFLGPGLGRWDEQTVRHRLVSFAAANANGSGITYTILSRSGEVLGQGGVKEIDHLNQHGEFGIILRASAWHTRVAPEAVRLLLSRAFDRVHRLSMQTTATNVRSIGLLRRMGCQSEGSFREYYRRPDGRFVDALLFGLLRPEWPSCRDRLRDLIASRPPMA